MVTWRVPVLAGLKATPVPLFVTLEKYPYFSGTAVYNTTYRDGDRAHVSAACLTV